MRVLLLSLAAVALPAGAQVRFVKQHDEACKFVVQKTCETIRSPQKCLDWHKAHAAKAGADTVELVNQTQQTDHYPLSTGGGYSSTETVMIADYYDCGPSPGSGG